MIYPVRKASKLIFPHRLFAFAVLAVTLHLSFPQFSHAAVSREQLPSPDPTSALMIPLMRARVEVIDVPPTPFLFAGYQTREEEVNKEPQQQTQKPRRVLWVLVTAYSSTPDQTDGSPYITAKNTFVRDGVVAANFLAFNTKLRMPQYFGDKVFVVEDRMHQRFSNRIDIWMPTRGEAKQWGAKWVKVEVL